MRIAHGAVALVGALAVLPSLQGGVLAQKPQHAATAHAKITADQARASALKRFPGRVEGKVALENEDGKWQYSVNVRSGKTLREVMVDSRTGKIASVEVTTKAEEAREAAAEAHAKHSAAGPHGGGTQK